MKNWIPLLLLAGAAAGDVGDNPGEDPIKQAREQALAQDTIEHARIYTAHLYAGTPQTGMFAVIPFGGNYGTIAGLKSSDGRTRVILTLRDGEPAIAGIKDDKAVVIPLFALAEHLGIEPEGRSGEQDDQAKPFEVPESPPED